MRDDVARARRFAEAVEVESERERRTMDSTTDHAARISARIEEYKTLDLIGRNSADDLQHHLRALVAERDEARARAARLLLWGMEMESMLYAIQRRYPDRYSDYSPGEHRRDHLQPGDAPEHHTTDLAAAPGDTAGER